MRRWWPRGERGSDGGGASSSPSSPSSMAARVQARRAGGDGSEMERGAKVSGGEHLRLVLTRPARPLRARRTSCTPASHAARAGSRLRVGADPRAHLSLTPGEEKRKCVFPTTVNRRFDQFGDRIWESGNWMNCCTLNYLQVCQLAHIQNRPAIMKFA